MGTWTVESLTPSVNDMREPFGNVLGVIFKIRYRASHHSSFAEMPRLQWGETITMVEKNALTWWRHNVDQYERDPNSQTFVNWVNRYAAAHQVVRKHWYGPQEPVQLWDRHEQPLPRETFTDTHDWGERAAQVRAYLKKHGGVMRIHVEDRPGINRPQLGNAASHKERILTFDCGLQGSPIRVKAIQHLVVDSATTDATWFRECVLETYSRPFRTAGMQQVAAPPDVLLVKPFTGRESEGRFL